MKQGAFLVNTSRGPLIDLDALSTALGEGRSRRRRARRPRDRTTRSDGSAPARIPAVVLTPHAAFYSEEATVEQQRKAAEQIVAALAGRTPAYAVNADVLSDG